MGTPEAAVPSLQRCLEEGHEVLAVWTQPDRPAGRGNRLKASPVKEFALSRGLTVHQPTKIRTDEAKSLFASHQADVTVVVAYGRILPPEFLRAPMRGCINVHFSLLPLYRGAAPVNWAIVNGEQKTGVTTMFIKEELDAGPILLQQETEIGPKMTAPELMQELSGLGADLLGETLSKLPVITPRPQRDQDATLAPLLKKEDGIIDWSSSAQAIERCVRGFRPWPNAYTHYKSSQIIIWSAEPIEETAGDAAAGEVVEAQRGRLIVQCGNQTALRLLEVQLEAKRRMSAREFLNGKHLKTGDKLE
jgi:methionyl-tRNA formyltransferase